MLNPFSKPKQPMPAHIQVAHLDNSPSVYLGLMDANDVPRYQMLFTPEQAEEIARDFDRVAALARQWREANNA